jgi:hypothetical protein
VPGVTLVGIEQEIVPAVVLVTEPILVTPLVKDPELFDNCAINVLPLLKAVVELIV